MPFVKSLGKTNCLTYIPNDVKLSLSNGTLTLKAGSKVYIPNGFEADGSLKFDEVVIESDLAQASFSSSSTFEFNLFYNENTGGLRYFNKTQISSGSTAPTGGGYLLWYDTTNNLMKTSSDGGSTWLSGLSLPLCKFTASSTTITSIDQVFNGFGYIGSTVFALPNVKGLIPNGWNDDGTYKNIEVTVGKVLTASAPALPIWTILDNGNGWRLHAVSNTTPYVNSSLWYDEKNNIIYTQGGTGNIYTKVLPFAAVVGSASAGVTSLTPNSIKTTNDVRYYHLAKAGRKYYKDVVTTKYWKEITTGSRELEYACYNTGQAYVYAKAPLGSDLNCYQGTGYNPIIVSSSSELVVNPAWPYISVTESGLVQRGWQGNVTYTRYTAGDLYKGTTTTTTVEGTPEDYTYTTEETTTVVVSANEDWTRYEVVNMKAYAPTIQDEFTYRITQTQRNTGTYTITLDRDCVGNLLFVGNGGPGNSSAKDSRWHYSGGGSGACFQGRVRLPKGTYTLTIGTLGSAGFSANNHYNSGGVASTDSYLTNSAGQELIRVGAGGKGYTSVGGYGGAGGVLKLGTLDVIETTKAVNGTTGGNTESTNFAKSAYDGTTSGYGAGTGSTQNKGTTYGVAGIFDLRIEYLDKGLRSY